MKWTEIVTVCLMVFFPASSTAVSSDGDDPLDWLRTSIPGEPGVDYPILSNVGKSSFSCAGLVFGGYYADPEQDCQAFHVCLQDNDSQDDLSFASFLCPNGTMFAQDRFICDWWFNVDCEISTSLYPAAEGAFGTAGGSGDGGECPAPGKGLDCAGAVSNCWSPGQRDTDCPNNGLCCFDGCADTCVDGPRPKPQPRPSSQPQPRPSSRPTPRPQPVVFEEEEIETVVRPLVIKTTSRPTTPRRTTKSQRPTTPPAPTTYRPSFTKPEITTGYSYETPDPDLPSLYGPPDTARRGRKGRRG